MVYEYCVIGNGLIGQPLPLHLHANRRVCACLAQLTESKTSISPAMKMIPELPATGIAIHTGRILRGETQYSCKNWQKQLLFRSSGQCRFCTATVPRTAAPHPFSSAMVTAILLRSSSIKTSGAESFNPKLTLRRSTLKQVNAGPL